MGVNVGVEVGVFVGVEVGVLVGVSVGVNVMVGVGVAVANKPLTTPHDEADMLKTASTTVTMKSFLCILRSSSMNRNFVGSFIIGILRCEFK